MLGSGSVVVMDETTCVVRAAPGGSRSSSTASPAVSARRVERERSWLEQILRRIEEGYGRESDLDLLMDACDNIAPGRQLAAGADDDLRARTVDPLRRSPRHPDVPRRVPRPHQRWRAAPTESTGDRRRPRPEPPRLCRSPSTGSRSRPVRAN